MSSSVARLRRECERWGQRATRRWYSQRASPPLMPLAGAFVLASGTRRWLYRRGWLRSIAVGVPVIVVGNITVGGNGKTPLCLALVNILIARGRRVGVLLRGYGGRARAYPLRVTRQTAASEAGDEAALIARRVAARVIVDPKRARGAQALARDCDVIVVDDGLQHYRLRRDAEIAVTDADRGLGNGWRLPAGPLREAPRRLERVDLHLKAGAAADFERVGETAVRLIDGYRQPLAAFAGQRVDALAGIADPDRFFAFLRGHGLDCGEYRLPDHAAKPAAIYPPRAARSLLMTEKDAVKWPSDSPVEAWCVPIAARLSPAAEARVARLLDNVLDSTARPGGSLCVLP